MTPSSDRRSGRDRREFPRVPTTLTAQLRVLAEDTPRICVVSDLSMGGAGLKYEGEIPRSGLVCALDIAGFGNFDGITVHHGDSVAGVRFLVGEAERHDLLRKLTQFVTQGMVGAGSRVMLRLASGHESDCEVVNITLQGALLRSTVVPPVGGMVAIGHMYGRVVTHRPEGIEVEFLQFTANGAVA